MKKTLLIAVYAVFVLMFFSTAHGEDVNFSGDIQPFFTSKCKRCHGGFFPSAGLDLTTWDAYKNIVNVKSKKADGLLVSPGDSAKSVLYLRITGTSAGKLMPPGKNVMPQNVKVKEWIDQGAMNN